MARQTPYAGMSCIVRFKNYVAVSGIFDRVSDELMVDPTKAAIIGQ
jgi:hypothetical protein